MPGSFFATSEEFEAASRLALKDSNLSKGLSFKLVYDLGDYWEFSCKVLDILSEGTSNAHDCVKAVGEAPDQYGDY